jgi:nicotinate phosphoribosyltransferase
MMQAYFLRGRAGGAEQQAVFDMYYREVPSGGGYVIVAGLAQLIEYIEGLRFRADDIAYLRGTGIFREEFLEYLPSFRFSGSIHAMPEGTVIFPNEPIVRITAPIMEAQFIETALLNIINHQSLIATKAARVCHAARGESVLEFGLRRAHGPDAGLYGARAAVLGGCAATSNTLAGKLFDIPVRGTHAHSWIMSFPTELEAFRTYAELYPYDLTLLVDTYDTLKSGVPNAIQVFLELKEKGACPARYGIRLDSGDLAYLSKQARTMLDTAGLADAFICASNDLDEYLISELKGQGAAITVWGVGTHLITSKESPALGGVYKLVSLQNGGGEWVPKIKISNNPAKVTNPGIKQVWRLYDEATGKIKADLICLAHEVVDPSQDLTIFDPVATWKRMTLAAGTFTARPLLVPVFENGKCVYPSIPVAEIRTYAATERESLWEEHRRLVRAQLMYVDLSEELYLLKNTLIKEAQANGAD